VSAYSALSPVSIGVFTALNVAALAAVAPGGVGDDIAQGTGYPFVLYTVAEEEVDGLGSTSGTPGLVVEIDLLVQVFSQYGGMSEAQAVLAKVKELLRTPPTVTGFTSVDIFRRGPSVDLGDQLVAGVKVKELAQRFALFLVTQ
jgi:hypothetical protein